MIIESKRLWYLNITFDNNFCKARDINGNFN